jgi:hypothetical protein
LDRGCKNKETKGLFSKRGNADWYASQLTRSDPSDRDRVAAGNSGERGGAQVAAHGGRLADVD